MKKKLRYRFSKKKKIITRNETILHKKFTLKWWSSQDFYEIDKGLIFLFLFFWVWGRDFKVYILYCIVEVVIF